MSRTKQYFELLLERCDIRLNGTRPWDIRVHNDAVFSRVIKEGTLGLGEAYMEGWWDCDQLDVLFDRFLKSQLDTQIKPPLHIMMTNLMARMVNLQNKRRAIQGVQHYNIGNNLFKAMLDERMIYSCAYFKNTNNLDEAQTAKLKLSCEKLHLEPGMRLLDVGCGWGGLAKYAAENYGVSVVGITLSKEQYELAKKNCKGLDVEIRLQDYRDLHEPFDRVVSIGMFEHVGHINYNAYMRTIHKCLKEQGLFLLHTIGVDKTSYIADPWIRKYIFPNGMLPSMAQISQTSEPYFTLEDLHNFGPYYDKTLLAWRDNFVQNWDKLSKHYDERFYRMWLYYLLSCAGGFRARGMQLWQIVLSKGGYPMPYHAPR
ncbi:cyclopropane fatty acyl phospholipid synthase [Legionella impletisoli]|uniref:Cyclopropane-fatty-acyl-phospholipid synthase n=1 Tax=Legionella impletisoli TaxID=343510 RepID=A0A917JW24_9GAMM|nr:cyclopropane fatty acyl phospholipid synthase [Legionella impletisoli]GGI89059.1 cyclopropane-fatty-acyl-phospholipid synthase [Legionella impletisoli]